MTDKQTRESERWSFEEQERGQRFRIFYPCPPFSGLTIARNIVGKERAGIIAQAPAMRDFIKKIVFHADLQPRGQAGNMDDLHIVEIDQSDADEARAILKRIDDAHDQP